MIVLAGGNLVLPDRILTGGCLLIDGERIAAVESQALVEPAGATIVDARDCFVVPGFIDVHVHGVDGHDSLDDGDALTRIAAALPRYGVTAFCPTTVACAPDALARLLAQVRAAAPDGRRAPPGCCRRISGQLHQSRTPGRAARSRACACPLRAAG